MIERSVIIKWAGLNTPFVMLSNSNQRLYLTKRQVVELHQELGEFMQYYSGSFEPQVLDDKDHFDQDPMEFRNDHEGC